MSNEPRSREEVNAAHDDTNEQVREACDNIKLAASMSEGDDPVSNLMKAVVGALLQSGGDNPNDHGLVIDHNGYEVEIHERFASPLYQPPGRFYIIVAGKDGSADQYLWSDGTWHFDCGQGWFQNLREVSEALAKANYDTLLPPRYNNEKNCEQ